MNEIPFRNWLSSNGVNKKVISDIVSRLKRLERELCPLDIDEQYRNDRCHLLIMAFAKKGNNEEMRQFPNNSLPIGKYHMNSFRLALRKYVNFCDAFNAKPV